MIDHVKARKALAGAIDLDSLQIATQAPGPERIAELRQLIGEACGGLSAEDLDLIADRVIDGATYEEIAERKAISVESARQRVSRLLKRLRSALSTS